MRGRKKKHGTWNDSKVNVEIANIIVIKFIVNRTDENIKWQDNDKMKNALNIMECEAGEK